MPENGDSGRYRSGSHLVFWPARRLMRTKNQVPQPGESDQYMQPMQPGKQENEPGVRVVRKNYARSQNLEPGADLSGQKCNSQGRRPDRKPKKCPLVISSEAMPGPFEGDAARQKNARGRPEYSRDSEMAPKQTRLGSVDKDRYDRSESHCDGGEHDNHGQQRKGI